MLVSQFFQPAVYLMNRVELVIQILFKRGFYVLIHPE